MAYSPSSPEARPAGRIVLAQLLLTSIVAGGALVIGTTEALSALIGGSVSTLANGLFALWVFGRYRAGQPDQLLHRLYGGELLKLLTIVLLLSLAFAWLRPLSPAALLGAFFIVQILPNLLANRLAG